MTSDVINQGQPNTTSSIGLFDLCRILIKKRKLIAYGITGVLVPTLIILLLLPNQYRSAATILPAKLSGEFSSLKALASLGGPRIQDESSSELYPVILRSRRITSDVIKAVYVNPSGREKSNITLADYFEQDNPDKLHNMLAGITSIDVDKNTGAISITVETDFPALSQMILVNYITELERYNLHSRKSKAKQVEQYLARELSDARRKLQENQEALKVFQEKNLNWHETYNPQILNELAWLERELLIQEQTYSYLSREHESAKLKIQMDTPIVRILDAPSLPHVKSGPYRLVLLLAIAAVTVFTLLLLIAILEGLKTRALTVDVAAYRCFHDDAVGAFPRISRLILPEFETELAEKINGHRTKTTLTFTKQNKQNENAL